MTDVRKETYLILVSPRTAARWVQPAFGAAVRPSFCVVLPTLNVAIA
jgi:hypothetical protein